MNKNYEAIHRYDFLTHDLLIEEYVKKGLTDREIAEKYDMPSKVVVWRKRKKYGIENRTPSKSNKNAKKNRKFEITKGEAEKLKQEGKTFREIAAHMGCSEIVAKRRFKEFGLSKEEKQVENFYYYHVNLSKSQKQLLIGSTLGDGFLNKHNAYYTNHSIKQSEYIHHKMEVLSSIHSGSYHHTDGIDPQGNPTKAISFTTGCNRYIVKLRKEFYPNDGKKIFPYELCMKYLENEGLAYWYMDDGCWHKSSYYSRIFINGFAEKCSENVIKFFSNKFNIDSKIHYTRDGNDGEAQFYLSFSVKESQKFIKLVRPYLIPSMMYKIGE